MEGDVGSSEGREDRIEIDQNIDHTASWKT